MLSQSSELLTLPSRERHIRILSNFRPDLICTARRTGFLDLLSRSAKLEKYRLIGSESGSGVVDVRLANRYFSKLFREYCIADMAMFKERKIGLRWRSETEVLTGKGQFCCANRYCNSCSCLESYEVHFHYMEACDVKKVLVKLRVCESCAVKLNYGSTTAKNKRRFLQTNPRLLIARKFPSDRIRNDIEYIHAKHEVFCDNNWNIKYTGCSEQAHESFSMLDKLDQGKPQKTVLGEFKFVKYLKEMCV